MNTGSLSAVRREYRDERRRGASRSPSCSRAGVRTPPGLPPARDERAASEGTLSTAFLSGLFGLAVSAGLGVVLVLIAAAAAYASPDPDALTGPLGLAALAVCSLAGGFAAARRGHRACLLCGLISGALMVLFVMTGSICFRDETRAALTLGMTGEVKAGLYAVILILEAVGGLIGRRRR